MKSTLDVSTDLSPPHSTLDQETVCMQRDTMASVDSGSDATALDGAATQGWGDFGFGTLFHEEEEPNWVPVRPAAHPSFKSESAAVSPF